MSCLLSFAENHIHGSQSHLGLLLFLQCFKLAVGHVLSVSLPCIIPKGKLMVKKDFEQHTSCGAMLSGLDGWLRQSYMNIT